MQNRKLIWITITAFCVAGVAAFLNSREKAPRSAPPLTIQDDVQIKKAPAFSRPVSTPVVSSDPAAIAVARVRELFAQDPEDKNGRAAALLNEYCQAGDFEIALKLVDTVSGDTRVDWQYIVFTHWAQRQPLNAMDAVYAITNSGQRQLAFQAAIDGWNSNDPAGLADYAIQLPVSDDRTFAFRDAIANWSQQDPAALATWLNHLPKGDEYDLSVTWMLAHSDGANRSPQVAMQWVESISDPSYKQLAFQNVMTEWMKTDSDAARQYVATATWLDDSARTKILNSQ